jgi:hypothetical protein
MSIGNRRKLQTFQEIVAGLCYVATIVFLDLSMSAARATAAYYASHPQAGCGHSNAPTDYSTIFALIAIVLSFFGLYAAASNKRGLFAIGIALSLVAIYVAGGTAFRVNFCF